MPPNPCHRTSQHAETSVLSGGEALPSGIGLFLMQLSIILVTTKLLAVLLKRIHQPSVVAEVLGGILLGPSALGSIPGYLDRIFPRESLGGFTLVANTGLVLYLFLVGLELDPAQIAKTGTTALKIALAGIAVPFGLGALVAILLHKEQSGKDPAFANVSYASLAVFTGVGMSITAFPVLARILTETGLIAVPIGKMTLSAAAFNDAVAWCLLALAIALVQSSGTPVDAVYIFLIMIAYCVFLYVAVRPALEMAVRWANHSHSGFCRSSLLAVVFVCIFVSGWFTQVIGLDAIFGAFLIGVILPRDEELVKVVEKFEDIVRVVFLPLYFTLSGLKTNIASINSVQAFGLFCLVFALAVAGKLIGCVSAARLSGMQPRESFAIGLLMNTRGLVELIVLNLGLQAKVINVEIFTIMVLMALMTTFMTVPAIRYFYPKDYWERQSRESILKGLVGKVEGTAATRRQRRLQRLLTARRPSEVSFTIMVSADQSESMVRALYLLLPKDTCRTKLITALFSDSLSTTTLMAERLGHVEDPDAREIRLAGNIFGAQVEVASLPATGNVAKLMTLQMNQADVDVTVLPWNGSHVDYQTSTWFTLPMVEGTIVLFRDADSLEMPRLLSRHEEAYASVLVLLHGEKDETAVLDMMERMYLREEIELHICGYKHVSKSAQETLNRHNLSIIMAHTEAELNHLLDEFDVDVIVYGHVHPKKSLRGYGKHLPFSTGSGGTLPRLSKHKHSTSNFFNILSQIHFEPPTGDHDSTPGHSENSSAEAMAVEEGEAGVEMAVQGGPGAGGQLEAGGKWSLGKEDKDEHEHHMDEENMRAIVQQLADKRRTAGPHPVSVMEVHRGMAQRASSRAAQASDQALALLGEGGSPRDASNSTSPVAEPLKPGPVKASETKEEPRVQFSV